MKISTNCSSLVILGDDFFFPLPPFFLSFFFFFFFSCIQNKLKPPAGNLGTFYYKQINNKHIIYQRGVFFL